MSTSLAVVCPLSGDALAVEPCFDAVLAQCGTDDRLYAVFSGADPDRWEWLHAHARCDSRLTPVRAAGAGYAAAVSAGTAAAVAAGARWAVMMEPGVRHPPAALLRLIAALEGGYEFAGGSRVLPGGAHRASVAAQAYARGVTLAARVRLGAQMTDLTSTFFAMNARAMQVLLERPLYSRSEAAAVEIRQRMHALRWTEVPYRERRVARAAVGAVAWETLRLLYRGPAGVSGWGPRAFRTRPPSGATEPGVS